MNCHFTVVLFRFIRHERTLAWARGPRLREPANTGRLRGASGLGQAGADGSAAGRVTRDSTQAKVGRGDRELAADWLFSDRMLIIDSASVPQTWRIVATEMSCGLGSEPGSAGTVSPFVQMQCVRNSSAQGQCGERVAVLAVSKM